MTCIEKLILRIFKEILSSVSVIVLSDGEVYSTKIIIKRNTNTTK